jgi:hypothetical protein
MPDVSIRLSRCSSFIASQFFRNPLVTLPNLNHSLYDNPALSPSFISLQYPTWGNVATTRFRTVEWGTRWPLSGDAKDSPSARRHFVWACDLHIDNRL